MTLWNAALVQQVFTQNPRFAPSYFVVTAPHSLQCFPSLDDAKRNYREAVEAGRTRKCNAAQGESGREVYAPRGGDPTHYAHVRVLPGSIWKCTGIEPIDKNRFWVRLADSLAEDFGAFNRHHQSIGSLSTSGEPTATSVLREQDRNEKAHSGWVMWDRGTWVHEVERMGLIEGKESRSRVAELTVSLAGSKLSAAQTTNIWEKMAFITPIHHFDSMSRNVVLVKSNYNMYATSGPTMANVTRLSQPPFKQGEGVLSMSKCILDGGWTFHQVKRRHYASDKEQDASGWLCSNAIDFHTTTLKV